MSNTQKNNGKKNMGNKKKNTKTVKKKNNTKTATKKIATNNVKSTIKNKIAKKNIRYYLKNIFKLIKKYILVIVLLVSLITSVIYNIKLSNKDMVTENVVLDENVVFFGDSITKKYNLSEFYPNTHVVNSGVSGDFTNDLVNRVENDVYRYNPSKVFILIGFNDINHDRSQKEIIDNIQKIVNGIKTNRKNAKIYIESIYPINITVDDPFTDNECTDKIIEINKMIEELCKKNNVNYLNLFDELSDKDGNLKEVYTFDGVHLNDLGYFKVTMLLQKYVK